MMVATVRKIARASVAIMLIVIWPHSAAAQEGGHLVPVIDLLFNNTTTDIPPDGGGEDADLQVLPDDTGGEHIAKLLGSTDAAYGYYVYLPASYETVSLNYPVLIFLHGKGERGNGGSQIATLNKVLRHGPPKIINAGNWQTRYPMIVISPQYHGTSGNRNNWGAGNPQNLKNFIQYVINNYRVNTKRIYLTGLSHGGNGVYDYLTRLNESQSLIAAAAPIAAFGLKNGVENSRNTPVWAFVGNNDNPNFAKTRDFYNAYNSQLPTPTTPAKLSVFSGAGHNVWTRVYSGSGIGTASTDFDVFEQSLADWFFEFKRS